MKTTERQRINYLKKHAPVGKIYEKHTYKNETHVITSYAGDAFHYVVEEMADGSLEIGEK